MGRMKPPVVPEEPAEVVSDDGTRAVGDPCRFGSCTPQALDRYVRIRSRPDRSTTRGVTGAPHGGDNLTPIRVNPAPAVPRRHLQLPMAGPRVCNFNVGSCVRAGV